jgi:GGDEF domain-containing protein
MGRLRDIGYPAARRLLLALGISVLLITAAIMYARRVDTVEVAATLLFMVVFVAFVFWKIPGGVVAAVLVTIAYASMRYPAIEVVGLDRFLGLIASRAFAYLAFGVLGGWASQNLEGSLAKLELYDQVDDSTGLYNARFFVEDTDLEMSRAQRYSTIFSVAVADIPADALDNLERKQRNSALRHLGRLIAHSVRTVDRAVHGADNGRHRLAVVLPETGREGVNIFTERLVDRLAAYLNQRGASIPPSAIGRVALTYPGDDAALQLLREEFAAIDRAEHPEAHELRAEAEQV